MQPADNAAEAVQPKSTETAHAAPLHASSTGQEATAAEWLDVHFEASRPEYEACVDMAGFQPGWHVLDAGCGSGSFLPLLAKAIGDCGQLTAIDLASDNVEMTKSRIGSWDLACPVEVLEASILNLPFPDNHFDAAWIANVFMYLRESELQSALSELHRVVRPGGLICSKEGDTRLPNFYLIPYSWYAAMGAFFPGGDHARLLRFFLRDEGIEVLRHETFAVERWSPLTDVQHTFLGSFLSTVASAASNVEMPVDARDFLQAQLDPSSPDAFVNQQDIATFGAHVLTVGRVPVTGG